MTETTDRLELRLAYLERANNDLSDVVYRQQQEIDALRLQLSALLARFEADRTEQTPYSAEEERPPHY
jgi:uncharacterized coiled-coil protein SlyX